MLGLIGDKAELIEPASCIGHGACKAACPTAPSRWCLARDPRHRAADRQTRLQDECARLFIAGELGGMGLIRNAIEQGRQAMESIKALPVSGNPPTCFMW